MNTPGRHVIRIIIDEAQVTGSRCLLLIVSHGQDRADTFHSAVALAKISNISLKVAALYSTRLIKNNGFQTFDSLSPGRIGDARSPFHWLESLVAVERAGGLKVTVTWKWNGESLHGMQDFVRATMPVMLIKDISYAPAMRRSFLSPLDWYLLSQCVCPIQFLPRVSSRSPRRILAAVNMFRPYESELHLNELLLKKASRLAHLCLASLHVIYVYDWTAIHMRSTSIFGARPLEREFQDALSDGLKEAFELLCDRHGVDDQNHYFLTGSSAVTVANFARHYDFDVLVMGLRPSSNGKKLMGSTAESIMVHAPCNVLLVPAGPHESVS